MESCPQAFQTGLHGGSGRRMEQAGHDLFARRHQLDLQAAKQQVIGELAADQPGAEDQHALFAGGGAAKARVVFQVVDRQDQRLGITLDRHANRLGAPGQYQVAVGYGFLTNPQLAVAGVDAADAGVGTDLSLELFGHGAGLGHGQAVGVLVLAEAGGQHRLGVGASVIGGDQQQRGFAVELAELLGQVIAGQAGTDDHHGCAHDDSLQFEGFRDSGMGVAGRR